MIYYFVDLPKVLASKINFDYFMYIMTCQSFFKAKYVNVSSIISVNEWSFSYHYIFFFILSHWKGIIKIVHQSIKRNLS